MDKDAFLARYGGIFEHSPFIAERGFSLLPSGNDDPNASTVHVALCKAFRAASREERLTVLCAHPELAGRLALDEGLTPASRSEQSGAGLDRLDEGELARFTDLNARYRERFGFPFIIAVAGLGKADILRAFERRISNTLPAEFATACGEVEKIALVRLRALYRES